MSDADFVAVELKQYTINTLNSLGKEIDDQYDKWAKERVGFIPLLCAAHGDAANDQAATITQQQEEQRRAFERAMLIFSILGVAAIDVIGAGIELKLAPKLISEYDKTTVNYVGTMTITTVGRKRAGAGVAINRKVMGDVSNDFMDIMFALGTKYDGAPSGYKDGDFSTLAYSPNATAFAQKIFAELDQQRKSIKAYVNRVSQDVNNSPVFGVNLVQKLLDENKMVNAIEKLAFNMLGKLPDRNAMIKAGHFWIDAVFDEKRKKWVDGDGDENGYYYYGYDPPAKPDWPRIRRYLERLIWAVWILQQKLSIHVNKDADPGWFSASDSYTLYGASGDIFARSGGFASSIKDNPITVRLFETHSAPVMDLLTGSTWSHRVDCQTQLDKLNNWAKNLDWALADLQKNLGGTKRPWKTVSQIW